jgi:hypothetical protein
MAAKQGSVMSWTQKQFLFFRLSLALLAGMVLATLVQGQAATHFIGTVSVISGNAITVKTAQGDEHQVQVPASADLKSIAPGQTSLSAAVPMQFSEIAVGDRVLVWIDPNSAAGTQQALRVVAIKAADLAKKREQEAQEWQQNGVGGLVKSVDAASGTIVITSGAGPTTKVVTIHTNNTTVLKRYAPASVSYGQAQAAPISAIHAGDQLMARGEKNSTGEVTAVEVVSGTFRNISGVIASIDAAHSTFTLKDLATKKPVTVQVPEDAQMRKIPDRVAQFLAARLKGTTPAQGGGGSGANAGGGSSAGATGGSEHQHGGMGGNMDPQQMLSRAPVIHFADLQKGDAVMLVGTPGDSQVTAITLISGVEPLLEAPASQNLLANWSMGGGDAGASATQ